MKYYVVADVHADFSIMHRALERAGFFSDAAPHKLIMLGDSFDRGPEPKEMQSFILELMEKDAVILIKGNHDDMFEELATKDHGLQYAHHVWNGTYETALVLSGFDPAQAKMRNYAFADAIKETPLFQKIIPAMRDYYETEHYIFVHGWIPTFHQDREYWENPDWRKNATPTAWKMARWYNGMDLRQICSEEKTIVCGHWHCSYGHSKSEGKPEFGPGADFSPYYGPGIIAMDGCTAQSGIVNVLALDDD
ncbi:MAG: metallophosphoesterase [Acidaminococcaceae bacterium]|nr:metallophosphoesterase [Acidaminococcaceae bacterium]